METGPEFRTLNCASGRLRRYLMERKDCLGQGHFTPCINRWINGATRISATPEPTRAQNPKV